MKRAFDFFVALIFILILSPLLLFFYIVIRLDSPGGAFFLQDRVGFNGRLFKILKFRSMVVNAERIGHYYTVDNDSRITRVGRFVRKTSIDELPQLFNVLKGDMSIVGPRPNVPVQYDLYTDKEWLLRNSVRPGITGLAQALLRSEATQEMRTQLDLEYVQKLSFKYDLRIILLTVKQVLSKGGN